MPRKPTYEELEKRINELEGEANYRQVVEDLAEFIVRWLPDGKRTFVNDSYCRYFDQTREEVIGTSFFPLIDKKDREKVKKRLSSLTPEDPFSTDVHRVVRRDGSMGWNLWTDRAIYDKNGSLIEYQSTGRDITELKQSQEMLRAERDFINKALNTQPDTFFVFEIATGQPVRWNESFNRISGYSDDEIRSMKAPDSYYGKEDLARVAAIINTVLEKGMSLVELSLITKDGRAIPTEYTASVIKGQDDKPKYIIAIGRDITERIKSQAEITRRKAEFEAIFNSITDAVVFVDKQRRILMVNKAFTVILGYTIEEIAGQTTQVFCANPEEYQNQGEKRYHIGAQVASPVYEIEYQRRDGTVFPSETLGAEVKDETGETIGFLGIIRDISNRKEIEKSLRESERKSKSVIESSPMGIFIYSLEPDGRLIFRDANPAADKILQMDCRQFIGKTIEEAFPSLAQTEVPDRYRLAARKGVSWRTEQLEYKDSQIEGAYEVYAFQTSPNRMAALFLDITKRRQMEEELQKVEKMKSIGILAGGIAHDFNNILTGILGNISLAMMYTKPEEKVFAFLIESEKATLRARDLTKQLLTFSKGGAPIKKSIFISDVIKDSIGFALRGSSVKCEYIFPEDLCPIDCDEGQLSQVFQNLAINASHAMPGGGTLSIKAENITLQAEDIPSLRQGKYVKISFADTGTGIAPEHIPSLFEPYFSTKHNGSGLGLATTYSIITKHAGRITLDSEPDFGTTFHIYLPSSEEIPLVQKKAPQKSIKGKGKILIMDDEKLVREVAAKILSILGYDTELAGDGDEAIALFKKAQAEKQPFAAVLLDLTIPGGLGGKDTLRKLLRLDCDVKAIVSSGYADDPVMADFQQYGFKGVVPKPYKMDELGAVLHTVIKEEK